MPGPFGQPAPIVDLGAEIGAGYQQNAANKIAQAKVAQRKSYTSGLAKKYGVTDVVKTTKGLTDTDIFDLATKLVTQRRGPVKVTAPIAPKPAAKKRAPKVTLKSSTPTRRRKPRRRLAAAPVLRRRRRQARRSPATTAPTINRVTQANIARATRAGLD